MGIRPAPLPGERAIVGMRPARKERMEQKRSSMGRRKESLWTYCAVRAYAQREVLDLKPVRMWAYARALRRACSKDKPSNGEKGKHPNRGKGNQTQGTPTQTPGATTHTKTHTQHTQHGTRKRKNTKRPKMQRKGEPQRKSERDECKRAATVSVYKW